MVFEILEAVSEDLSMLQTNLDGIQSLNIIQLNYFLNETRKVSEWIEEYMNSYALSETTGPNVYQDSSVLISEYIAQLLKIGHYISTITFKTLFLEKGIYILNLLLLICRKWL